MSTKETELDAFRVFVDRELRDGKTCTTVDQAVAKFREYQRLKAKLATSQAESQRGQSSPLDIEDVIAEGAARAAEKGITD